MAAVRIERKSVGMPSVRRDKVKTGEIFQKVMRDGKLGKKQYIHVGRNGKDYSVNVTNGELASTGNFGSSVTVVGKARLETNYFKHNGLWVSKRRRDVRSGEIFQVAGQNARYAAMGRLTDGRYASKNLNDPSDDDYAVTNNGDSSVSVIGTWELVGTALA